MPPSSKLPFSVAMFSIEDAGEGAGHLVLAPPRLPSTRTAPVMTSELPFPINPFSLSCHSLPKPLTIICSPRGPVNSSLLSASFPSTSSSRIPVNSSNNFPSPASVPSASSSLHVQSLFPNPFLIEQNLNLLVDQHTLVVPAKPAADSPTFSDHIPSPNIRTLRPSCPTIPLTALATSHDPNTSTRRPRKPRPDRVLESNSFRPRVMAVDRLFSWRTPYGLSHDALLRSELPPALAESAKMSITGALAVSLRSTYAAGLLRFNQFCDRWQISEGSRMPASYALLCAFIGNYKGSISGRTVKSWLSGIRAWHLTNHAPWYGDDKWVQMARISANKEGSRHKRPLRAPVSIEHLLAL
jgi:hypothetical protein